MRSVRRLAIVAMAGGLLAVVALAVATIHRPALTFEMDRNLPRSMTGFYPLERAGDETWVWTGARAGLRLDGLDRGAPWTCTVRLRGTRPPDRPQPTVSATVDGVVAASLTATNDYQDFDVTLPIRGRTGATIVFSIDPTFVPGGGDPRELGVQVDRIACVPASRWILPPGRALMTAAAVGAVFGLASIAAGLSLGGGLGLVVVVALAAGALLSAHGASYGPYPGVLAWLACWVALGLVGIAHLPRLWLDRPLSAPAVAACGISALAVFAELGGLLHPAKSLVDALFQAHRLEWVMTGRYFFTQPMPDGVAFPYAIGLYVVAAPWTLLTSDLVALLRVVVIVSQAIAGGLLYLLVARRWDRPAAGVWAVVLFHLVPLPYVVVGNGNLTNAFAQAVALMAVAAATVWALRPTRVGPLVGVALLAALAFCSHVSTMVLLGAGLVALVVALAVIGGRAMRPAAVALLLATVAAGVFAVGAYYGHFMDVYERALTRVGADSSVAAPPGAGDAPATSRGPMARASSVLSETVTGLGWPILLLAIVGALVTPWRQARDPLTCAVLAWGAVWLVFSAAHVVAHVDTAYERYAIEFLGRVNLATYPAAVLLAARAVAIPWPDGIARARVMLAGVFVAATIWQGSAAWLHWFI